jgi:hypothetical protein
MAKPGNVKVAVIATDPTGAEVAFETSGWNAAHNLRRTIESYPSRSFGWQYERMVRVISQREVRS